MTSWQIQRDRETQVDVFETPHQRRMATLSDHLCEAAFDMHRREFDRITRRVDAAREFQGILDNLKGRIAQRAETRTTHAPMMPGIASPEAA